MDKLFHAPGFFGTHANLAADVTLVVMILAALLFTYGFYLARQKRFAAHRWVQTGAAILNAILVLWMMILPFRDFVIRDSGGPRPRVFYAITTAHGFIGLAGLLFGVFVTLRGNELVPRPLKFKDYKTFMRASYGLYILATVLGVWVYWTWFVSIPNPPQF